MSPPDGHVDVSRMLTGLDVSADTTLGVLGANRPCRPAGPR